MDKRRNTLDRFQRIAFGRKSKPSVSSEAASNEGCRSFGPDKQSGSEKQCNLSERSERLKELTELLRGGNISCASSTPTPPPVPPPRKPRISHNNSTTSSTETHECQLSTCGLVDSDPGMTTELLKQISTNSNKSGSGSISVPATAARILHSIRPNTSLSNLEAFMMCTREKSKSPPPFAEDDAVEPTSTEWASQLSRPESRIGSSTSTQKGILPFRSVSFSQIDCKSTLSALRDRLRRDKAIETPPPIQNNTKTIESADLLCDRSRIPEPGWVHIPLKNTGLSINLNYGQEKSLEHVLEDVPDIIGEEDIFNTDNCSIAGALPATASSVIAAHAKMESLSDTIPSEGEYNINKDCATMTVNRNLTPNIEEPKVDSEFSSPNIGKLLEEQCLIESSSDNILQTATTCLIPVPVYECAAQEWLETPTQEWVELAPEFDIVPEIIQPPVSHAACKIMQTETLTTLPSNLLPRISVSRSSEEGDECGKDIILPHAELMSDRHNTCDSVENQLQQCSQEDLVLELQSSDTIATPRHSTGERQKRYLDKSTKRKGMYIDNSDWHQPVALDISVANFQANKPDSTNETQMYTNSPIMFEMNTPELEKASPTWRRSNEKSQLLSSFSCQSSEEKEDATNNNTSKTNSILQNDSLSDTEERVSWSPTPSGDYENKRYSKRPLTVRGPYGQMLEAELKKQNRMNFDEILEEIRDADRLHPRREHSIVERNPLVGSIRSNMPQYSNSMRVRKSSAYLPVPTHARAASTPSQIEHVNKPISLSAKDLNETILEADKQPQNLIKRAASETPTPKMHHSKRNNNENKSQHHHNHHYHSTKRNVEGNNSSSNKPKVPYSADVPPTAALLAELLKGSSENMLSEQRQKMIADTRTYVVQEIYRNEQSYVESLQTVVLKYLKVLKSPEHAGMIDTRTVDEIFFMVPDILEIHEKFLAELKQRLDDWDIQQKVGDTFIETFSKLEVLEVYTSFVNNCNRAKNAIRLMKHQRPSFAKFLESTAREHKGKLTLDNLLIKPVQKFPNYELLFQRLIKHTDHDHPDQKHLQDVLKLVHDILVHINCKEREIMENGQREATLRELEGVIEGITDLIAPERQFLLFDLVSMPSGQGARKDRGFFLFNDLLVLTSIKKRSGTIRKPNSSICPGSVATTLDTNKYKFLTKISLDCLEIVKSKDENIKRIVSEIENLSEDSNKLQQITEITASIKYPHQYLEDVIRELHREIQRQLSERQTNDTPLNMLELTVSSPNGSQKLTVVFSKPERRSNWEEVFIEAKLKLAATLERHPIPEFLTSIPIRKTRAGLQFTCAAATLSDKRDVWVCNSDGYVGQVCIMSLHPEPNVTSCNGVCNARILCVASVPAYSNTPEEQLSGQEDKQQILRCTSTLSHSYTQQLRDYRKSISPIAQPVLGLTVLEKKKIPTSIIGNGADGTSNSDTQLDLNLSSSEDEADVVSAAPLEQRIPSPAPSLHATYHLQQDSNPDENECNQSTMWIGTEDGCIHVYNSTDNIRIKKNRIKIEHHSAVFSILYLDNRVFVSLANGDICVYLRDGASSWNTCSSHCLSIGTVSSPVTKLLNVNGKLWCSIQGIIKVLDTESFSVVNQIQISSDSKPITNMTVANSFVWISIQNSAYIKCFHSNTHQLITEVNLAPAVNKMLSNCDEIIRQHKAACLRVTSLLCCKDLIWIGTSAGVLLTIPAQGYEKGAHNIVPTGIPHGHTGHVRFLTFVETPSHGLEGNSQIIPPATSREAGSGTSDEYTKPGSTKNSKKKLETKNILIISGGDGYEDFRNSGANSLSEIAGREDSTNHLLIWQI
ncbi:rho guanine nucleotide exchange factor 17 isoform X1 [Drosophila montana]|uniref:rho guanine nucleotide exchange factor 17 isoform X1 n=1 Tax=Drosophila montana TaxID=40370 RepID=UPI00313F22B8